MRYSIFLFHKLNVVVSLVTSVHGTSHNCQNYKMFNFFKNVSFVYYNEVHN